MDAGPGWIDIFLEGYVVAGTYACTLQLIQDNSSKTAPEQDIGSKTGVE